MPTLPKPDAIRRNRTPPTIPQENLESHAPVIVPEADPDWTDLARDWYGSLAISAQSQLYDSSDWQEAKVAAGLLSAMFTKGERVNATAYQAFVQASSRLLTCIGDRRRARVEVHRPTADDEAKRKSAMMDEYRRVAS